MSPADCSDPKELSDEQELNLVQCAGDGVLAAGDQPNRAEDADKAAGLVCDTTGDALTRTSAYVAAASAKSLAA